MRRLVYVLALGLAACAPPQPEPGARAGTATGIRFLGEQEPAAGFARADEVRRFRFPEDHGSHPEFRSEWWYFTGNLEGRDERRFGFELTFFRLALAADAPRRESAWSTNQVFLAHLALTDPEGGRFRSAERLARGAQGLAGVEGEPLRVWVESWSAAALDADEPLTLALAAHAHDLGLDLRLQALGPPVPQGDDGLDRKGPERGNASYYYSIPRLAADGTIEIEGEQFAVSGLAWLDREWGTSALTGDVVGWDWFALHLSDGRDLMYYRLRERDGSASAFSGGSLIARDGARVALGVNDVVATPLDEWTSPATGVRYPVAWRLELPAQSIEVELLPYVENQELDLTVRYWEGAVSGSGTAAGAPLTAVGYLELAGY